MRRSIIVGLGAALSVSMCGCSQPDAKQKLQTATSGDLTIQFTMEQWPAHAGDNTALVTVMSNGAPVNDANIVASADMTAPKLSGSPASGRFEGNGQYSVPLRLVATTYNVDVKVIRVDRQATDVTFPLEAWQ